MLAYNKPSRCLFGCGTAYYTRGCDLGKGRGLCPLWTNFLRRIKVKGMYPCRAPLFNRPGLWHWPLNMTWRFPRIMCLSTRRATRIERVAPYFWDDATLSLVAILGGSLTGDRMISTHTLGRSCGSAVSRMIWYLSCSRALRSRAGETNVSL